MPVLRELDEQGKLNAIQKLVTAETRPEEELYDLSVDPFEINNLALDEKYLDTLDDMRNCLKVWISETGDKGVEPESEDMYDSDMNVYLGKKRNETLVKNIAIMKQWAAEGK